MLTIPTYSPPSFTTLGELLPGQLIDRLSPYRDLLTEPEQRDLLAFVQSTFPTYQPSRHHREIAARLMRLADPDDTYRRLIITMPPRFGKSELASINFPAWYLGQNPDNRVIACSNTARLANRFSRLARNKIRHYRWAFPKVRLSDDQANIESWDLQGYRGGYIAAGVGGQVTGFGADLIIVDDAVKSAAQADSQTYRENTWEWYTETLRTRLEPNGAIIVIGTRWHESDLIGRLLADDGDTWDLYDFPAIGEDGQSQWPERWPLADLERIKRAVGSRAWHAQYMGQPQPDEGGMFKRHWWRRYTELPPLARIEIAVDSAYKTGVENDYSVFAAWGADADGNAYLLNLWRERVAFPDLIRLGYRAVDWCRSTYPAIEPLLVVEDQASGQSAIQTWRSGVAGRSVSVTEYPVAGQGSKLARAEAVTPLVEGGRVFIPESAAWLDDWLTEHDRFPNGKYDDQVDTTAIGLARLMQASGWSELQSGLGRWMGESGV